MEGGDEGGAHLGDVLGRTGVQAIVDGGLLSAGGPTEGMLQGAVGAHPGVDLDHAPTAGQDVDETIQPFVEGACSRTFYLILTGAQTTDQMPGRPIGQNLGTEPICP